MILKITVVFVALQLCSGADFDWCSLTCDGGKKHTMCIYKAGGGDACAAVKRGLTAEEKEVVLDYHNQLRAKVANGKETTGPQPSAADMNQLVWDDEVAEIAQRWVDQCEQPGGHDKCRITKDKVKVGQNFAESGGYGMAVDRTATIKDLVQSWYDEVKDMDPSLVSSIQFKGPVIGHYTQVVWGKTTRVGCGLAHKQEGDNGEFEVRLICNYKIAGNFIGQPVYTEGEAASKCTKKSTKYPGLCEPQEEGDKPESDASAPTSSTSTPTSSSSSPSNGASTGSSKPATSFSSSSYGKPIAFASSGFGKPVAAFASAGFGHPSNSFSSVGLPQGLSSFGSFSSFNNKPSDIQKFFQSMHQMPGGSLSSYQLPPSPSKGPTKVYSFSSDKMSMDDFDKMFGNYGKKK